MKKYLKWMYVLLWMVLIFIFSNQDASHSNNNNRFIIDFLKNFGFNLDIIIGNKVNYLIRKLAHMTEYFILFYLLYNAVSDKCRKGRALILSLAITFVYALTDEFHQGFVPGRGPSFKDVMIDTGGGSIALLLVVIRNIREKLSKPRIN